VANNEVEMEIALEKDAEGDLIPLLNEDGRQLQDPITGMPQLMPQRRRALPAPEVIDTESSEVL
jgi:hypothetical protein